jgi:hypothetical protein
MKEQNIFLKQDIGIVVVAFVFGTSFICRLSVKESQNRI